MLAIAEELNHHYFHCLMIVVIALKTNIAVRPVSSVTEWCNATNLPKYIGGTGIQVYLKASCHP